MKILIHLTIAALLSSCASTTIYDKNGHPVFHTQADMINITFKSAEGSTLHVESVNHSSPMQVQATATTAAITAVMTAVGLGVLVP